MGVNQKGVDEMGSKRSENKQFHLWFRLCYQVSSLVSLM